MLPGYFPSWEWLMERNDLGVGSLSQTNFIRSVEEIYIRWFFLLGDLNPDAFVRHQEGPSWNAVCSGRPWPSVTAPQPWVFASSHCSGQFLLLTDSHECQPPSKHASAFYRVSFLDTAQTPLAHMQTHSSVPGRLCPGKQPSRSGSGREVLPSQGFQRGGS